MGSIAGMKHLGKIVRQLREARGLTLEGVADKMPNYDSGNLSRFERGKQDIAMVKLEAIAEILETPVHEMMRRAAELDDPVPIAREATPAYGGVAGLQVDASLSAPQSGLIRGVKQMPVLNDSQAASLAESSAALSAATDHIETTEDLGPLGFGWRVKDDSMTSDAALSFPPGVTVLFKPMAAHTTGDCVLVRLGPAEVQFCQLTRAAGVWYMSPLNRRYSPRPLPEGAVILGIAVAAQFRVPRGGS